MAIGRASFRAIALAFTVAALGCAEARLPDGLSGAEARARTPNLRIADADFDRDPRTVNAADALSDLDLAAFVFEEAYAGAFGGEGMPSDAAFTAARGAIARRPVWAPADLAGLLRDLFRQPDAHLAFGYGGRAPLWLRSVAPRPAVSRESGPTSRPIELIEGEVPVLAIRSFENEHEVAMRALPELARRLRRSPQFVVDLRGNAGGNYAFAERFIVELTDRELRRLDEREVVSVAAAEGRANTVRRRLSAGGVPAGALPHFRAQLDALDGLALGLTKAEAVRTDLVTQNATLRGRADGPLRSRAVLLVDGGCASACEMMVALARQIPGVVVVGESTRGGMAFGELAVFRLPRSGVMVAMGTRAFSDPLGAFAETRGFEPDLRVEAGRALEGAKHAALASWTPSRARSVHGPALARMSPAR